jgi:hypothetical protein
MKSGTILTLEDLKSGKPVSCYIALSGGGRSGKWIQYYPDDKEFYVVNEIDGSEQWLIEEKLLDKAYSNIGFALKNGALIAY